MISYKEHLMGKQTVRFGVIGTGRIGSLHARNLAHRTPGVHVEAVIDVDRERAEAVAAE